MQIVTVLRSGGRYTTTDVMRLRGQCALHLPDVPFCVLTDTYVPAVPCYQLKTDWPGWWAKLELFRPDLFPASMKGVLYMDLDTVLVGDCTPLIQRLDRQNLWMLEHNTEWAILRDAYRPEGLQSAVMYWRTPSFAMRRLFMHFSKSPGETMTRIGGAGDQAVLEEAVTSGLLPKPRILQEEFPGMMASYKANNLDDGPRDAKLVFFHGYPKPGDFRSGWVHTAHCFPDKFNRMWNKAE